MRRLGVWFGVVSLVVLAAPVAARAVGAERGLLGLSVAFIPWVSAALAVTVAVLLLARAWVLAGVAGALIALCLYWISPLYIGGGGGGQPVVTVASVNMTLGGADADAVVDLVRSHSIDVLVVVELTPGAADALADAGLDHELAYSVLRPEPGVPGVGLWSRERMANVQDLPGFTAHALSAKIDSPSGAFTMFAVHPQAPGKHNQDNWIADLSALHDVLEAADGPVIVAGDFNTTRDQPGVRRIEALGYVDAADRIDAGFRATFPANRELFPLVAIDHVMTRDVPLRPATFELVNIPRADHLALVVGYTPSGGP